MDAELPIGRRRFLGRVFEHWRYQVLGIVVGFFSLRVPRASRASIGEIETRVESETTDTDWPDTDDKTYDEIDWPDTDDGF